MVTGVVDDHGGFLSPRTPAAKKTFEETVEGNSVEFALFGLHAKAFGTDVHGSLVADLRPVRGRGKLGISDN